MKKEITTAENTKMFLDAKCKNIVEEINTDVALDYISHNYGGAVIKNMPIGEIAALGSIFASFPTCFRTMQDTITTSKMGEGLFRCVFPEGVTGSLFRFKDGSGFLGGIAKDGGGLAQARWIPAGEEKITNTTTATLPIDPATILMAVAILAIAKEIEEIKEGQREIIGILERDKKSQLLADYDILVD